MDRQTGQTVPGPINYEEIWKNLKDAVHGIFGMNGTLYSFEELYRTVYQMVTGKRGKIVYTDLRAMIEEHCREKVCPIVQSSTTENVLANFTSVWSDFTVAMEKVRDLLMYIDRNYVVMEKVKPVYDLGLELFYAKVVNSDELRSKLTDTLLEMINLERNNVTIEWNEVRAVLQMLLTLSCDTRQYYNEIFEVPFLGVSRVHFFQLSEQFLAKNNSSVYVQEVSKCLLDEKQRADRYFDSITESKVLQIIKEELITKNLKNIVDNETSGMLFMLDNQKIDDLRGLYDIATLIPEGKNILTGALGKYIRDLGKNLTESTKEPLKLVQDLLQLKDRFGTLAKSAFVDDFDFKKAMCDDFSHFFNATPKCAESLALYVDYLLKKGSKHGFTEDKIEEHLDKAVILFKFLQNKDIFERFHKNYMAKRLLLDRTLSTEIEQYMISKLKTEWGSGFAHNLQKMLTDATLKEEISDRFKDSAYSENCVETTAMVLTSHTWTIKTDTTFELVPEVQLAMEKFTEFYQSQHTGRKLSFSLKASRGEIVTTFFPVRYTFIATTAQISVLSLFNNSTEYTFKKLCEDLKMDFKLALDALQQIVGTGILTVTQGSLKSEDATLVLNQQFQSKKRKVDLTRIVGKPNDPKEAQQIQSEVEEERKYEIEAASVRIMKTRKKLKHALLIAEVISQMKARFNPDVSVIKKVIESLVDREFLERDENDFETLKYIA